MPQPPFVIIVGDLVEQARGRDPVLGKAVADLIHRANDWHPIEVLVVHVNNRGKVPTLGLFVGKEAFKVLNPFHQD